MFCSAVFGAWELRRQDNLSFLKMACCADNRAENVFVSHKEFRCGTRTIQKTIQPLYNYTNLITRLYFFLH